MEKLGGKCKKLKNLVESGKIWQKFEKWKNLFWKICKVFGKSVKKWKNIEAAKNGKLENSGKTWWKVTKSEKLLVESGKIWKTWWKVGKFGKSLKSGKFVKICETLENLSKNEKILKWQKIENWKILEKPGKMWKTWWTVEKICKSLKSGKICFVKRENLLKNEKILKRQKRETGKLCKKLVKSGKIWKTWWKVEKFCKSLKSGKIC